MPAPAFTAIADAAVAALKAAAVADGRVFHIIPDEAALAKSYVAVGVEGADPERGGVMGAPVDWQTALRIDCYVRFGVKNPRSHEGVNDLFAAAYAALMADPTLTGLVGGLEPGPASWNFGDAEMQSGVVTARFFVVHQTEALTLAPRT